MYLLYIEQDRIPAGKYLLWSQSEIRCFQLTVSVLLERLLQAIQWKQISLNFLESMKKIKNVIK